MVRARGYLICGIDRAEAEYSSTDEHGSRTAFDRDLCRAIAVAALGPKAQVLVKLYADDSTSTEALLDGKADVVASLTTDLSHAAGRNASSHIRFTAPVLLDPVSLMVPRSGGIRHASELSGKLVCLLSETNVQDKVQAWFEAHHLDLLPFPFQEEGEMEAAFVIGRCAAIAGDLTRVAETRTATGSKAREYLLLPDALADDPLAMAYPASDPEWQNLVAGTRNLLFSADRLGLTAGKLNAEESAATQEQLDTLEKSGECRGLTRAQIAAVIRSVGSYSEIYARDLASTTALELTR